MLDIKQVSKFFPGVKALDRVSLVFQPGQVHAVVGENGAGKSTLIKIICGIYIPDEGEVVLNGEKLALKSYSDALEKKISLVSQEIQVIPKSTIAENIMLDKMEHFTRRGAINWKQLNREADKYIRMVELNLPPDTEVGGLSAAQKQLIMIAKSLSSDAQILILDEPTSALTRHETDNLLKLMRKLADDGVTIIFVNHKLEEVLAVSDKVSVLRDGQYVGTRDVEGLQKDDIVKMMIGRDARTIYLGQLDIDWNTTVLEARNISQENTFKNVSFSLHKGEILGFYGLVGSGRTELARILIGEDPRDGGQIIINGQVARIHSMADSLYKYQMGYVSENRKELGLLLNSTIQTNVAITVWNRMLNGIKAISLKQERAITEKFMEAVDVKATGPDQIVNDLSGGNQQKVSISKWLAAGCDILIIDEPTIGVDVGAKEYIHKLIWDLAKVEGKSIILISSDMPEMVNLARRILIFKEFEIVGEIDNLNDREHSYEEVSQAIGQYLA
ncbi:MAG: sugar ABC transporter ATP-binding protein [Chloroflexi bacterium]|nr:MAG: sugar ABC transporter ATP-binding protein [Chloroflexota bacterium]